MFQKILVLDNFDSFTFNLVDYFRSLGCQVQTYRNTMAPEVLEEVDFDLLVLSPGPSVPRNAGNMMAVIDRFHSRKPIFGVCLGHQALVEYFGGSLQFLKPVHGKADRILTDGKTIYTGLPAEIEIGRYHSLAADSVPNSFEVSARNHEGVVMSIRHKELPIEGVQYHPESVLTMRGDSGYTIIRNVVEGRLATGNVGYYRLMRHLMGGQATDPAVLQEFVQLMQEGQLSEDQKLVLLAAFSARLNEPEALAQLVRVLLAAAEWKPAPLPTAVDVCGTGGSGLPRINTSTLAGIVLAAMGVPVLKHGNKAASGRYGSFDLLADLGLNLNATLPQVLAAYQTHHLGFVYAPKAHPVMGAFATARSRLGIPTIFNVLGPLLNPFRPSRQVIGCASASFQPILAETAGLLGNEVASVVRGHDGLDEVTLTGPTQVYEFIKEQSKDSAGQSPVMQYIVQPQDFGLEPVGLDQITAEHGAAARDAARAVLAGTGTAAHTNLVAVNAAFAYVRLHSPATPYRDAYQLALQTIKSGKAQGLFQQYAGSLAGE